MPVLDGVSEGELRLSVRGADSDSLLRSLRDWLSREDALRGRVALCPRPIAEGEMGGLVEALVVSLGSGGAGALIVQSVSTWLGQRRSDVTVTIKASDGREVTVDARCVRDPQAIISEVERLAASDE
ncbi:hypothetical protein H8N00_18960 [Streptomyces sp. AC563]|uniref:effector-associated constant component EACC1 n=1 Tax=Streptomyces buecherae TaxID=2763006 RepID=UPI00164D7578|nr:hypothetical protein [Streptomyces buecherae]MBC3990919.1 hypothetical protein [Streptomyces buecherae]